jgi:hypothetical protein
MNKLTRLLDKLDGTMILQGKYVFNLLNNLTKIDRQKSFSKQDLGRL